MRQITADELRKKKEGGDEIYLLDVREQYEHEEFNLGGKLLPLAELPARMDELEDLKLREVIVYCRTGNRSALAQHVLSQAGFSDVHNLKGGIVAWKEMIAENK